MITKGPSDASTSRTIKKKSYDFMYGWSGVKCPSTEVWATDFVSRDSLKVTVKGLFPPLHGQERAGGACRPTDHEDGTVKKQQLLPQD